MNNNKNVVYNISMESLNPALKNLKKVEQNISIPNQMNAKMTGSFNAGLKQLREVATRQDKTKIQASNK